MGDVAAAQSLGEEAYETANEEPHPLESGKAVAIEDSSLIYIPGVPAFDPYKIINDEDMRRGLTLEVEVQGDNVVGHTFEDSFQPPGEIITLVEFSNGGAQTKFKLPIAKYDGETFVVICEGGAYQISTFCVNGEPVVYPVKIV